MDPLTQLMMQRAMQSQGPPNPIVPPASGGKTHTPPELQRFINAQNMMQAYRNNWTPNPIIQQVQSRNS